MSQINKTTFLKLLMGEYTYQGAINASVHFDYFPFSVTSLNRTGLEIVAEIYPPYEYWAICKELTLLDLDASVLDRSFETLSQGERTKVLLAVLFLKENNFLLIDEPTNHLDLEGRTCVAKYLKRKKGYILVSHDRLFLDHCIDHVLSINKTHIDIQKGTFSSWMHNKAYQDQFELAKNQKLVKEIDRLGEAARRTAGWSALTEKSKFGVDVSDRGFMGHKAAKMMKRAKAIPQHPHRKLSYEWHHSAFQKLDRLLCLARYKWTVWNTRRLRQSAWCRRGPSQIHALETRPWPDPV